MRVKLVHIHIITALCNVQFRVCMIKWSCPPQNLFHVNFVVQTMLVFNIFRLYFMIMSITKDYWRKSSIYFKTDIKWWKRLSKEEKKHSFSSWNQSRQSGQDSMQEWQKRFQNIHNTRLPSTMRIKSVGKPTGNVLNKQYTRVLNISGHFHISPYCTRWCIAII